LNTKIKYILLIIAILSFALLYYNHNNELTETSFDSVELRYAKRFFGLGILCVGLYFFNKNWKNLLTKIMIVVFTLCLTLNLYIFPRVYNGVQINKIHYEYSDIETCKEMENRFSTDLKNNKIVYFQFGILDIELAKILRRKYRIKYVIGCTMQPEKECYNELVNEYLKKDFNKSISDIQKETDFYKLNENK
jgi:hypothetical protein